MRNNDAARAIACLAEQYEISDSSGLKKMRTIEITSYEGVPLRVLQSEDNKVAIENILRTNGWIVVSWTEDNLQLSPISVAAPLSIAAPRSANRPINVEVKKSWDESFQEGFNKVVIIIFVPAIIIFVLSSVISIIN